jgi:hypothetical protein
MSSHTYPASAVNSAHASTTAGVLRELFQSTPLYVLAIAVGIATGKPGQR